MHEFDAMEFIEPVLLGFLSRAVDAHEGEEPGLYEPHLKKIRAFIKDESPYWVREKSLYLILEIEKIESYIRNGKYIPTSPEICIDFILLNTQKGIMDVVEKNRLGFPNENCMHAVVPLPSFPKI